MELIQSCALPKLADVTGLDLSEDMLEIARKQSEEAGEAIEFRQGNSGCRKLVNMIWWLATLIHCYMWPVEVEVGDVFQQVYNCLNEGGVFIFDVHSTYQTDTVFPGYSYHENADEFAMVWDSYADEAPHSVVHELTFFLQDEDGRFTRATKSMKNTYEILTYDIY